MTNPEFWESAARRDPLWAILSDPSKRGRRWMLPEFFETGRREISLLFYQLKQLGHVPAPGRALDFGCGVGRLSQALAPHFSEVIALDISETMIQLGERLNRHPARVRYVKNERPDLSLFPRAHFTFVYSDIVLQHLDPETARGFVNEFLRVLEPGGVAVFQLPSHKRTVEEQPPRPSHMDPHAYRARIVAVDVPSSLDAGETVVATVDVQNASPVSWNQSVCGPIRLGNHWRDEGGTLLIQDDGRASLPVEVPSGAVLRLGVPIRAPQEGGTFICEFDLVHEALTWFADCGSASARISIRVQGSKDEKVRASDAISGGLPSPSSEEYPDIYATLPSEQPDIEGHFPMCGVPRHEVLALVEANGGVPFLIEDDERGGPEWRGFRYFVCK